MYKDRRQLSVMRHSCSVLQYIYTDKRAYEITFDKDKILKIPNMCNIAGGARISNNMTFQPVNRSTFCWSTSQDKTRPSEFCIVHHGLVILVFISIIIKSSLRKLIPKKKIMRMAKAVLNDLTVDEIKVAILNFQHCMCSHFSALIAD